MHLYFVGGIHGSGKTTLCRRLAATLDVSHHSAGELIRLGGVDQEDRQKSVRDVALNQRLLLNALDKIRRTGARDMFLDGHYTVVDSESHICPIGVEVFRDLSPTALVLVDAEPPVIVSRLRERDNKEYDLASIEDHARAERSHAQVVSELLGIPLLLVNDVDCIDDLSRQLNLTTSRLPGAS